MSREVQFGKARIGEFAAVNRLARQGHGLHVAGQPEVFRKTEVPISQAAFRALVEEERLYVLREGEALLAYGIVSFRQMDGPGLAPRAVMNLEQLCVSEERRRRGLGRQLLECLLRLGRERGCTDLQLTCDPHNIEAAAFYQKLGMTVKTVQYRLKL